MLRRFVSASIDQLEAALEDAVARADSDTIAELARELTFRRTPRAKELAERVARVTKTPSKPATRQHRKPEATATAAAPPAKPRASTRNPTDEQAVAIEAFGSQGSLKINAYAGTGKTSTLEFLAHSTQRRGQYIAFNKAIVVEAKERFPSTVHCATTHSLAVRSVRGAFPGPTDKLFGKISSQQLAELLGLRKAWRIDKEHLIQPRSQAFLVLDTVRRFTHSAAPEIAEEHVPLHGVLLTASDDAIAKVKEATLAGAQHVWGRMCNADDQIPIGHDGYLKYWALARPKIAADFILLDEAQDTNPVVLDVLRQQEAQLVYVGDRYQQIYEWRGAINAMEVIETDHTASLTQSFRFGNEIAGAASQLLKKLGESVTLRGNPAIRSRIAKCIPTAILSRTNASVMKGLIEALHDQRRPHLVGGKTELVEMLKGVKDLKEGNPSSVPDFFGFQNWDDVVEFSETVEGEHLKTFVTLVQEQGERRLLWALGQTVEEKDADVVLSTAHKAKGREWKNVRLADDFLKSRATLEQNKQPTAEETARQVAGEMRLLYVALTRAREVLDLPEPLAKLFGINTAEMSLDTAPKRSPESRQGRTVRKAVPSTPWTPPTDWQPPSPEVAALNENRAAVRPKGFLSRLFGR